MTAKVESSEGKTLEARTFELVKWLIDEKNEQLISLVEKIRMEQIIKQERAKLKPMTTEELIARDDASSENIRKGEVMDVEDLLRKYENEEY